MARPVKSYSELQQQLIDTELGRRESASRKAAEAALQMTSDDIATAPSFVKVLAAGG
jgi:hypothetical protein